MRRSNRENKQKSPNLSENDYSASEGETLMAAAVKNQNYDCIPLKSGKEDASQCSLPASRWICKNKSYRFNTMDFTHVHDTIISQLLLKKELHSFPLCVRSLPRNIREYIGDSISRPNKALIQKRVHTSSRDIISYMNTPSSNAFNCMGITKNIMLSTAGKSNDPCYNDDLSQGFNWICQNSIRNVASQLHNDNNNQTRTLIKKTGFIMVDENDYTKGYYYMSSNNTRADIPLDLYNQYTFHIDQCMNTTTDNIHCAACNGSMKTFRRKCAAKGRFERAGIVDSGRNIKYLLSSPSKAKESIVSRSKTIKRCKSHIYILKKQYTSLLSDTGMILSSSTSNILFNDETRKLYEKLLSDETDAVPQKELVQYLCARTWDNSATARRHGKKCKILSHHH